MGLRPKIVKLIDKYSQKKSTSECPNTRNTQFIHFLTVELTSMNENFVKARQMFDTMMEESLAKHNPGGKCHSTGDRRDFPIASSAAVYDWRNAPQNRPDSRNQGAPYDYQSIYGWNPQLMGQQGPQGPPPIAQYPAAYAQQVPNYAPTPAPQTQQGPYPPQNAPAHAVDYVVRISVSTQRIKLISLSSSRTDPLQLLTHSRHMLSNTLQLRNSHHQVLTHHIK